MSINATYVGAVILEIDGIEVEVQSFSKKHNTGRKSVKAMNRKASPLGYAMGIKTWELSFKAPIKIADKEFDLTLISKSKITYWPVGKPNARKSLIDVFVTNVSDDFETENEAIVNVEAEALGEINE